MLDTVFWKAAISGNWNTAENWLGDRVPGPDDTAIINATGADYTVTLDVSPTVAGFTLNSANAAFTASGRTFTVNGPGTLSAGSVLWRASTWAGSGTLTNSAGMTAQGAASISSPFLQNGTLLVQGSDAGGSTTLTVANGFTNAGTITLQSANAAWDSNLTLTSGTLTNAATGVVIVDAGGGGSRTVSADLTNQGTVTLNTLTTFPKPITNAGTFNLAASSLTLPQATPFTNQATGTFRVQTDAILNFGFTTFTNAGTFIKSGTAGTATVTGFNGSFINTGLIDVQTGRLHFPDNVTSRGAGNTFHAADGAAVTYAGFSPAGGGAKFTDTTFSGAGVNLLDLGTNQGTINGAISTSNLEFRSGELVGTSTVSGTLNWTGGTIRGTVNISANGTLNIVGDTAKTLAGGFTGVINNAGTTNWTGAGDFNLDNNATFNNTGVFNAQTDASLVQRTAGSSIFTNEGTFTKSGTPGTATVQLGRFSNTGTVDVQAGTLSFTGGATNLTASGVGNRFHAAAGAAVTFATGNGTFTDTDFAGPGAHVLAPQDFYRFTGSVKSTNLEFRSGRLWDGTSTIDGTLNWTGGQFLGTVNILPTSTLNIVGDAAKTLAGGFTGVINNAGTTNWTGAGDFNLDNNATFNNSGVFNVQTDASLVQRTAGGSIFSNQGTFTKTAGSGTASVRLGRFSNSSIVDVQTGTLSFPNGNVMSTDTGSTFHTAAGATLAFGGGEPVVANLANDGTLQVSSGSSLNVNGTLSNLSGTTLTSGTFVIGGTLRLPSAGGIVTNAAALVLDGASGQILTSSGASALATFVANAVNGSFTVQNGRNFTTGGAFTNAGNVTSRSASIFTVAGDYTQADTGSVTIEIGGNPASGQFGKVNSTGQSVLDGTLNVHLANGYGPQAGESFPIMSFPSRSGDFDTVSGLYLGRVQIFEAVRAATVVTLNALVDATDLAVQSITVQPTGTPGENVTISYTVRNLEAPPALGSWYDSIYLSRDDTLDADDPLIGRVQHVGDVEGMTNYTETLVAPLPAVVEADYRVIVVADSRALVADSNRANNTMTAASTLRASVPVLALDQTTAGTIASGQDLYFRVDVPPGIDVRLRANFALAAQAGFYVRFGDVPDLSTGSFNAVYHTPADRNQEILLTGISGAYYVRLHGLEAAGNGTAFDLTALAEAFEVRDVGPDHGSNLGQVTITITGSGFTPDAKVKLVRSDGGLAEPREAISIARRDSNTLFATLNLVGLAPGAYDVQVEDAGRSDTLDGAFTVNAGEAGKIVATISSPAVVRAGRPGFVTVEYWNDGETDMVAPLLVVEADIAFLDPPVPLRSLPSAGTSGGGGGGGGGGHASVIRPAQPPPPREITVNAVQFLGLSRDGPAGVLPPGGRGRFEFPFSRTFTGTVSIEFTLAEPADPDGPFSGNPKQDMRPPLVADDDAWDAIFGNFEAMAGNTVGSYANLLAANASYLSELGQFTPEVTRLLAFALQQADNAIPGGMLAGAIDAAAPTPELGLVLSRQYLQPISRRYAMGPFGRGWTTNWHVTARPINADGSVIIQAGTSYRRFVRLADGSFRGDLGDPGVLTRQGDSYTLRETDGTLTVFDAAGKAVKFQDRHGNTITAAYTDGRLRSLTHDNGATFTFDYNDQGRVSKLTDQSGQVTTYTYDAGGAHLMSVTGPGGTTSYTYLSGLGAATEHALNSITQPDGTHVYYGYDDLGRLIQSSRDGSVDAVTYDYADDAPGEIRATDALGNTTAMRFNDVGQLAEVRDPLGRVIRWEYDVQNNTVRTIAPGNINTVSQFDRNNNLISQVDPLGRRVGIKYDPAFSQLLSLVDSLGLATSFARDSAGNLQNLVYPDGSEEHFGFDNDGEMTEAVNRRGQPIRYTRDARGLVTRVDHANGSHEDYSYDARGNLLSASDSNGMITLEYADQINPDLLTKITYPSGRFLQFTYDAGGRRIRSADHDGFTTNYAYDAAGRLERLTDGSGELIASYHYDIAGRLDRKDLGNRTFTTYEYDAAGQLLHLVNHAADSSINSRFDYTYNAMGRRTSMTTLEGLTTYGYDAVGQLTSVALPGGRIIRYEYDANGNRLTVTDNGVVTPYTANNLNQYTAAGTATYTYDTDGNLLAKTEAGHTTHYAYDDFNRLVSVVSPAGAWTYEYDALGNRVATLHNGERTEYLVDPIGLGNVAGEYDEAGNLVVQYVHSGDGLVSRIDVNGPAAYYDFDAIGSTVGLSSTTGDYVNQYSYLPFGERLSATESVPNPFTYVGQFGVMDESNGLHFMRARFYSSGDGRFVQPDPIGIAGGLNLYGYVNNQPTGLIDPAGLQPPPGFFTTTLPALWNLRTLAPLPAPPLTPAQIEANFQAARAAIASNPGAQAFWAEFRAANSAFRLINLASRVATVGVYTGAVAGAFGVGFGLGSLIVWLDPKIGSFYGDLAYRWYEKHFLDPGPGGKTPGFPARDKGKSGTLQIASADPNDIIGPAGFGDEHFVRREETLPYTIRFENKASASAAAQEVRVTHQLDPDLDLSTFELGDFGFGEIVGRVPEGLSSVSARIDAREKLGYFVDVAADINLVTGLVTWTFTAVDPVTFDLPTDPFGGFLPPNQMPPIGEGFVSYRIRPKPGSVNGTRIDALATIVFDVEPPLDTPPIFNTLDADPPTSTVEALPATSQATFNVTWSGADAGGSGIATFDVFVSVDGGAFTLWRDDTPNLSDQYVGEVGHTYAFYSVATDNVGHVEGIPLTADTTTRTVPADANPPRITATVVQNGLTQRSYLDTLQFDFSEEVNLAAMISDGAITRAVTITNLGVHADLEADQSVILAPSQFRYEFDANSGLSRLMWSLDSFAGTHTSLSDGIYRLTLDADLLRDLAGNALDGDGNGAAGDDFVLSFHRLQGDADGNLVVNSGDMNLVNAALGAMPNSANWNVNADLDRDARVTVRDRVLVARASGNEIVPPSVPVAAAATILPGDFNRNGVVDAADYVVWRKNAGRAAGALPSHGDASGDGVVNGTDYAIWRQNYGLSLSESAGPTGDQTAASAAAANVGAGDWPVVAGYAAAGRYQDWDGSGTSNAIELPALVRADKKIAHDRVFAVLEDAWSKDRLNRFAPLRRPAVLRQPIFSGQDVVARRVEMNLALDDVFDDDHDDSSSSPLDFDGDDEGFNESADEAFGADEGLELALAML